jgi:hypothetical protein
MATVYSDVETQLTQNTPREHVKANEIGGEVRVARATYEASSLASGDVINMFTLPDGARILQGSLGHDAMGSSTTLSVGFAAHTNAAGTAVSASAAAYKAAAASTSAQIVDVANTLALLNGEEVDSDGNGKTVTVTMGGAAGTGTVALTMLYVTV